MKEYLLISSLNLIIRNIKLVAPFSSISSPTIPLISLKNVNKLCLKIPLQNRLVISLSPKAKPKALNCLLSQYCHRSLPNLNLDSVVSIGYFQLRLEAKLAKFLPRVTEEMSFKSISLCKKSFQLIFLKATKISKLEFYN